MGFSFSVPSQGEGVPPNHLKHSKNDSRPLGRVGEGLSEGWGGAFGGAGRGFATSAAPLLLRKELLEEEELIVYAIVPILRIVGTGTQDEVVVDATAEQTLVE